MEKTVYTNMTDEALVALSRAGDTRAEELLYVRYKNAVRARARPYYLTGADRDDLLQEGMIGLYKAIRDYDERCALFRTFADTCIHRQILTAVKTATRRKHMPLNSYVSLYGGEEGEVRPLIDTLRLQAEDPADAYMLAERQAGLDRALHDSLSPFEQQVLTLFLEGRPYKEIAQRLDRGVKAVDNALQRIKKKTEACLREAE